MAMSPNQSGGVFADINITPLTDIFLVLLIIFMVATAITIESAAHVDLPKVQSQATTDKPKGVAVMYTADHRDLRQSGRSDRKNAARVRSRTPSARIPTSWWCSRATRR